MYFVIHQAALGSVPRSLTDPLLYNENNITGSLNMLIASRDAKVRGFVFASSSSAYGDTEISPKIETMKLNPKSPYASTKLADEHYCKIFNDAYGLPTICLRYFNVFGPKQNPKSQYSAVIPKFIKACLNGESPVIYGDGFQTRDFTFIDNVVKANMNACFSYSSHYCGQNYNIGCNTNISVNNLARSILDLCGSKADMIYSPIRVGDVKDSLADIYKAEIALNYSDSVSFDDGLRKTVEWYKEQFKLDPDFL